jgi:hypothetical protein
MHGFERFGEFSRALQASKEAIAADPFIPYADDLRFAEGVLFSLALVLPFWILFGCALSLLLR